MNALYKGRGDGNFKAISGAAGAADTGYGNGAIGADFDEDGDADLYVTNFGADAMFMNEGNHFLRIDLDERLGTTGWSTSSAVLDYDRDGDLDLYVARYVDYEVDRDRDVDIPYLSMDEAMKHAGEETGYPHPDNFLAQHDLLLRNDSEKGRIRFSEVGAASGVPRDGKGLGVVTGDFDDDGWTDLYVANDAVPNFLLHNLGDGTFDEIGASTGVAYGQDGKAEAGMGVDVADYDSDGHLDLTLTNFQGEPNGVFRNDGSGYFLSHTFASGTGLITVPTLAFGTNFVDVNDDGRLDLFVGNGHVLDNVQFFDASTTYAQRNFLFLNRGENEYGNTVFEDVTQRAGPGLRVAAVTRGTAVGDIDLDGDVDLLAFNLGSAPTLLRNETSSHPAAIHLALVRPSGGVAYGARARVMIDGRWVVREISSGRSFLSQSSPDLHFGLSQSSKADSIRIRWPDGTWQALPPMPAGRHRLEQP